MNDERITPVLLGFNPTELSRDSKIEGWDKTFRNVVNLMKNSPKAIILNPIVGPESITGSTRMVNIFFFDFNFIFLFILLLIIFILFYFLYFDFNLFLFVILFLNLLERGGCNKNNS